VDLEQARFDGVPAYLREPGVRRWLALTDRERERLEQGVSALDPYGLSSPPELWAVAVEAFFQNPTVIAAAHRELYDFLASYFKQNPASWAEGGPDTGRADRAG